MLNVVGFFPFMLPVLKLYFSWFSMIKKGVGVQALMSLDVLLQQWGGI